jgi:hypothetical protein
LGKVEKPISKAVRGFFEGGKAYQQGGEGLF